jgi:hypothetical protein
LAWRMNRVAKVSAHHRCKNYYGRRRIMADQKRNSHYF